MDLPQQRGRQVDHRDVPRVQGEGEDPHAHHGQRVDRQRRFPGWNGG